MQKALRFVDDKVIHPCLGIFAVLLVVQIFWASQVRAQVVSDVEDLSSKVAVNEQRLQDEDRRLAALEGLKIDSRLTAIETQLKTGNTLQYTSTGGLVVLLAEVFLRKRRPKPSDLTGEKTSGKD